MPRTYGPLGLIVSLVVIVVLAIVYFAAPLALAALIATLAEGSEHAFALARGLWGALQSGAAGESATPFFALGVLFYATTVAAIVTVARWRAGPDWRSLVAWLPWSPLRAGWRFWLLVGVGLVYGAGASALLGWLRPDLQGLADFPRAPLGLAVSFVLVVLAAPIAEEALFRGWIYTSLRARFSFPLANVVSAAVFAIAHWDKTHLYALAIFPLGLLLGAAREKTGSIRASATFHGVYNCFAWVVTIYGAPGNPTGSAS